MDNEKLKETPDRHQEWFDTKSTSSGFVICWSLKLKEVV